MGCKGSKGTNQHVNEKKDYPRKSILNRVGFCFTSTSAVKLQRNGDTDIRVSRNIDILTYY